MEKLQSLQLDDDLSCSICLELYENPVTLPCLHSFCFDCLKGMNDLNESGQTITCPQCREKAQIPQGVESLPKNFDLNNIVEKVKRHKESKDTILKKTSNKSADLSSEGNLNVKSEGNKALTITASDGIQGNEHCQPNCENLSDVSSDFPPPCHHFEHHRPLFWHHQGPGFHPRRFPPPQHSRGNHPPPPHHPPPHHFPGGYPPPHHPPPHHFPGDHPPPHHPPPWRPRGHHGPRGCHRPHHGGRLH